MSTYSQVLSAPSQGRRQLWLIHGDEPALVQDAFELAKSHVFSLSGYVPSHTFIGEKATAEEITAKLREHTIEPRTLIVLLNADKFSEWEQLSAVLTTLPRTHFFIAVCDCVLPRETPLMGVFKGSQKVRNVLCRAFSDDDCIAWMKTKISIEDGAARLLIQYSNGDYEWLLNQIRKLSLIRSNVIRLEYVERLITSRGSPKLAKSLLNYQKRDAILSLQNSAGGYSEIDEIIETVRKAALVNESVRVIGFFSTPRINDRTKLNPKDIIECRPLSMLYDRTNTQRCLKSCVASYGNLGSGNRRSWLSLVSRW